MSAGLLGSYAGRQSFHIFPGGWETHYYLTHLLERQTHA